MDIHTTTSTDIQESRSWRDGAVFKSLEALRPWLQWAMIGVSFIFGFYLYQHDTNAQNNISVADLKREADSLKQVVANEKMQNAKEIEALRRDMVTKELFEERTSAIRKDVGELKTEIINRLPVRYP